MIHKFTQTAVGAAILALGLVGTSAAGQEPASRADLTVSTGGTTYYNQPGATWAEHSAAVRDCATQAGNAFYAWGSGETLPTIDFITAGHPSFQGFVENCMVLKGWRVIQMNPWKAQPLGRSSRSTLERVMTPLIGAEPPDGEIVRVFTNEAARGDTVFSRYLVTPAPPRTLSIRATDLGNLPRFNTVPAEPVEPVPPPANYRPYLESLSPEDLARLPDDAAVILVRVIGAGQTPGGGFTLKRMAPRTEPPARRSTALEPTDTVFVGATVSVMKLPEAERGDVLLAFPVVPGRYRAADRMMLDLCFGGPATEIGAGEVVYLGSFEIAGPAVLSPDTDLAPAQAFVGSNPALQDRLRPASWVNGTTDQCLGGSAYALEFPGLPFEEGYVRGVIPPPSMDEATPSGATSPGE